MFIFQIQIIINIYSYQFRFYNQQNISIMIKNNQHFEQKKQIYVLIKRIHLLELVYAYDWVKKQEYNEQISDLIQKYKNLRNILKNFSFDINKFAKEYKISEQLKIVDSIIERPVQKAVGQKDEVVMFMHATATFIKVNDILAINQQKPIVSQIKGSIEQLVFIMRKIKQKLSESFKQKTNDLEKSYKNLQEKNNSDLLSAEELNLLKNQVDSLYRLLQIEVQS